MEIKVNVHQKPNCIKCKMLKDGICTYTGLIARLFAICPNTNYARKKERELQGYG